jgi:signal transduction histidine kinase
MPDAPSVPPQPPGPTPASFRARWSERLAPLVRAFHVYATWLVSISWKRFILLSILLMIIAGILKEIPPFTWTLSERVEPAPPRVVVVPKPPKPPAPPGTPAPREEPTIRIEKSRPGKAGQDETVEISIGSHGVRITPRTAPAAASAAEAAASAAAAATQAERMAQEAERKSIRIVVPPGAGDEVKQAVEEARDSIRQAIEEARQAAEDARHDAEEARRDAERAIEELADGGSLRQRITRTSLGDMLPNLALLWIFCSVIVKITYKKQLVAQAQAAQATEVAESEQLKRQVVEARMAAMQAQVEPHFLFNTLASIDHLIETDPPRASQMQKNLIALLRASMPTMREASSNGAPRDLGREMAVIRPYLEILKVRMEERLATRIDVPDGLLSAEFPPMMIQSLVENAIKHGLEPKPEGGELRITAEIVHGKLAVTVADTGLGFGKAATAGTGVGLANIRERLQLLYGTAAKLTVAENPGGGTAVTVTVPYRTVGGATMAA